MRKVSVSMLLVFFVTACGQEAQFGSSVLSSSKGTQSSLSSGDGIGDEIVESEDLDDGEIHIEDIDLVEEARCGKEGQNHKVLVCHHPSGNVGNRHEICISQSALKAHIDRHGDEQSKDYVGSCDNSEESAEESTAEESEDNGEKCDHKENRRRRKDK